MRIPVFLVVAAGAIIAGGAWAPTIADPGMDSTMDTRTYAGTRVIHHAVATLADRKQDPDHDGVFVVEASRTTKRTGNVVLVTEARAFTERSGGYYARAAFREVVLRDEHVDGANGDIRLDEATIDRATFGYLASRCPGSCIHSPFDEVDRRSIDERYVSPPVVYMKRAGVRRNDPARTTTTTITDGLHEDQPGYITESVAEDGTVQAGANDSVLSESFVQNADGSGKTNSGTPGFGMTDRIITPPSPSSSDGTYAIVISTSSTGRTVGPPPYPVATSIATIPDWYPGGKALPRDTDAVVASGPADTPVPAACGRATSGRFAHRVVARRTRTRIDGKTEIDSDETYWTGTLLLCEIERRHTESFDLETGKLGTIDDVTTSLGLTRL